MDNRTYFQSNPVKLDVSRSTFPLDHRMWTNFNAGELVPLFLYSDVLPGDTFDLSMSFVMRSTTPRAPVMDDAEIQVEFYFVPHEFVLHRSSMTPAINDSNHSFAAFMKAQDNLLNVTPPSSGIVLPSLLTGDGGLTFDKDVYFKSPSQYFGIPSAAVVSLANQPFFNPLKALAFYKVWSDNYRDPNLHNPVTYSIVSGGGTGYDFISFTPNAAAGFKTDSGGIVRLSCSNLPLVCAYHGYFGSALPWPQRNATAVTLPLGQDAPVITKATDGVAWSSSTPGLKWVGNTSTSPGTQLSYGIEVASPGKATSVASSTTGASPFTWVPSNLYADLSQATAATINTIRSAFALQRFYEQLARGGNARLSDMAAVMFGVTPHNIGDDRCEYLGGKRIPISQTMVAQQAQDSSKPLGTLGSYSNTSDASHYFTKSFDTWGTIVGVCCVRHQTIISQSLSKMDSRKENFDYYWPQFANLGEVPIKLGELMYIGSVNDEEEFGFQEYAAEYRYLPDRVYGRFIPDIEIGGTTYHGDLAYLTYADRLMGMDKADQLDLGSFIDASRQKGDFDETLTTTSTAAGFQFILNAFFKIKATRPMPLYSIPGLLDHH